MYKLIAPCIHTVSDRKPTESALECLTTHLFTAHLMTLLVAQPVGSNDGRIMNWKEC
jgi:hypothetical protein